MTKPEEVSRKEVWKFAAINKSKEISGLIGNSGIAFSLSAYQFLNLKYIPTCINVLEYGVGGTFFKFSRTHHHGSKRCSFHAIFLGMIYSKPSAEIIFTSFASGPTVVLLFVSAILCVLYD